MPTAGRPGAKSKSGPFVTSVSKMSLLDLCRVGVEGAAQDRRLTGESSELDGKDEAARCRRDAARTDDACEQHRKSKLEYIPR